MGLVLTKKMAKKNERWSSKNKVFLQTSDGEITLVLVKAPRSGAVRIHIQAPKSVIIDRGDRKEENEA